VALPRDGAYTISASSYRRGITGTYLLEVERVRPEISIATPAMLAGRWRRSTEEACDDPAIITVEGGDLVYTRGGTSSREQILDGIGRTIRTRAAGDDEGEETGYALAEDGDQFEQDGVTWVRCR
jgi:hypothetical protein